MQTTLTGAPATVIDQLDAALVTTGSIVAGIPTARWNDPTPCAGWNVRTVTNHLVGGLRIVAGQLTGIDALGDHDRHDWLRDAPTAAYRDAAAAVLAAWRAEGAMSRTLQMSFGPVPAPLGAIIELTEVVVHGADMGIDAFRLPGVFGPAVDAPTDATAHQRLQAFLGRVPATVS